MIQSILNDVVFEIPKLSQKIARKKSDAQRHALTKGAETTQQTKIRLEKEAKAQALKRSLETKDQHEARLERERKCQLAKFEDPDVPNEYFEKKIGFARKKQRKLRDAWTPNERQNYNSKKNDYQKEKKEVKLKMNIRLDSRLTVITNGKGEKTSRMLLWLLVQEY